MTFPWMQTLYQTNIVDATIWVLLCAEFTMFRCRCRIFGGFQVCFVSTLHPLFYLHPLCSTTEDMRAGFFYFYSYFSFLKYCDNLFLNIFKMTIMSEHWLKFNCIVETEEKVQKIQNADNNNTANKTMVQFWGRKKPKIQNFWSKQLHQKHLVFTVF